MLVYITLRSAPRYVIITAKREERQREREREREGAHGAASATESCRSLRSSRITERPLWYSHFDNAASRERKREIDKSLPAPSFSCRFNKNVRGETLDETSCDVPANRYSTRECRRSILEMCEIVHASAENSFCDLSRSEWTRLTPPAFLRHWAFGEFGARFARAWACGP